MQEINFDETVEQILTKDARYHREAYYFVREALDHTQKILSKEKPRKQQHVSGQELLDGIRQHALSQFGPMTITVLEEWGINSGRDFGEIVFNMVEIGLLAKEDKDSRADFQNSYTFEDAFRKPFLPTSKLKRETPAPKATQV